MKSVSDTSLNSVMHLNPSEQMPVTHQPVLTHLLSVPIQTHCFSGCHLTDLKSSLIVLLSAQLRLKPQKDFRSVKPDCPVTDSAVAESSDPDWYGNFADCLYFLSQVFPVKYVYSLLLSLRFESLDSLFSVKIPAPVTMHSGSPIL